MERANRYLQTVFIPQFWQQQLTVKTRSPDTEFTPLSRHIDLDNICIIKDYRKIRNDHTFSYGNKFYFIVSPIKHSIAHQKIEIRKLNGNQFNAYFAGRQLSISEVIEPTKASIEDIEIQKKLDVLALTEKLGNVSEASRLSGVSRETIYQYRRLINEGGIQALKRRENPDLRHKNRSSESLERLVVDFSLRNPHLGQVQVSRQLKEKYTADISPNGVRGIWLREKMNTAALRVHRSQSTG